MSKSAYTLLKELEKAHGGPLTTEELLDEVIFGLKKKEVEELLEHITNELEIKKQSRDKNE
jgi:hypothetical protein